MLGLEALQIRNLSWRIYKQDIYNFSELFQVCISVAYSVLRFVEIDKSIIPKGETKSEAWRMQYWVVLNTIMVILIVLKIMYFMKVSVNLAKIVKLTVRVFEDVAAFTIFMIFWICVFVQLYLVSGINLFANVSEDYPVMTLPVALWI